MTITDLGKQFICENFGDASLCCINTGLSWFYTVGGIDYNETGGTAQIVSRLASGLIDSLTMTNPARGTFTQTELNNANGAPVTIQDAQEITLHDEPTEDQWCFIACNAHPDQTTCEYYGCFWYNGACHDVSPDCSILDNTTDCSAYGCFWYNGACHSSWTCSSINNELDCSAYGCYWYNGTCNSDPPACEILNNELDCSGYGCYWFRNECHSIDQPELCYWTDAKGGPTALLITDVFEIIDAYVFQTAPTGYAFIPNIENTMGIIDYYLGFIDSGNTKTGCAY